MGTLLTRVYYTLRVDNQQAFSFMFQAPQSDLIERQFQLRGSDLRTYRQNFSILKSLLHSFYVAAYPLNPSYRGLLERNIRNAIENNLNILSNNTYPKLVNVLYYELYNTPRRTNISRVYYSVGSNPNLSFFFILIFIKIKHLSFTLEISWFIRAR